MKPDYIFLAGAEKGGTTALASWLSENGIASFVSPGIKESYRYLSTGAAHPLPADTPWLDASAGYFSSPEVISRLPEHRTKIVLCLRNPLARAWSAYRMKKIAALGGNAATEMFTDYQQHAGCIGSSPTALDLLRDVTALSYPRISSGHIQRHFNAEAARLRVANFAERADYEMQFLMSHRTFPFLSVLQGSFYYAGLRAFAARYLPQDILLVSMSRLKDPRHREIFLQRLVAHAPATEPLKFAFSSSALAFDEPAPDFDAPALQSLRGALAYDTRQYTALVASHGIADDLLDWEALGQHLT
jgi:hypothetical protein